jgi:galactokinase
VIALDDFLDVFRDRFGRDPEVIARAPGRVNLIGEHTDYNDGFVLPVAIHLEIWAGASRRKDRKLAAYSVEHQEERTVRLDDLRKGADPCWIDYPAGIASQLLSRGAHFGGANLLVAGDVPVGAGLSSSAALLISVLTAWKHLFSLSIPDIETIRIGQRAENEYVGVSCGIMDHYASCVGRAGHALLIDCRDLGAESIPLPRGLEIVVCNTGVRRDLATSEYNRRREECAKGVEILRELDPAIRSLRNVTPRHLNEGWARLPDAVARRCRHVVSENDRVGRAVEAFRRGDLAAVGALMQASHDSLKVDYEVSCPELDSMVEIARKQPGVIGSRMTGAGFGGCTVNLVNDGVAEQAAEEILAEYSLRFSHPAAVYVCRSADGASLLSRFR